MPLLDKIVVHVVMLADLVTGIPHKDDSNQLLSKRGVVFYRRSVVLSMACSAIPKVSVKSKWGIVVDLSHSIADNVVPHPLSSFGALLVCKFNRLGRRYLDPF